MSQIPVRSLPHVDPRGFAAREVTADPPEHWGRTPWEPERPAMPPPPTALHAQVYTNLGSRVGDNALTPSLTVPPRTTSPAHFTVESFSKKLNARQTTCRAASETD